MAKTFTADTLDTALVILTEARPYQRGRAAFTRDQIRDALNVARELERLERGLRRRAEYACNFPMTEAHTAASDRRDDRAAEKVAELLKPYTMAAKIGGDVRGSQIHLLTPKTGRANTMGGTEAGWAV